jgi:LysR family transcriptional regulator, hydrogen peroxide-inducible genes activator
MTLQQLEYVVALDSHRNFVIAANKCFVTQPTLTMQLKKMEDEIGVLIFDRNKKPVQPTLAGERIIMKARQILQEVDQLKAFLSNERESLHGSFAIGIIPTLAPYLLPLLLPSFNQENPVTYLQIYEQQSEEIIRGLKNNTIDIGILVTPLKEKSIREIVLFQEPFLLYHPLDHQFAKANKVKPEMLHLSEMLILDEGHCFRNQTLNICNSETNKNNLGFNYQSGSIETLKNLVNKNLGYTLVPELSVHSRHDHTQIKRFESPEPVREISLAVHKSFTKELLIEKLRNIILKQIPDNFAKNNKYMKVMWR